MTHTQSIRYEMLLRVAKFGENHRDLFPSDSLGGPTFGAVEEAVTHLTAHGISKMSSASGGKGARASARKALVSALEELRRNARVIANDVPGFADPFQLARNRTDRALLMTARSFVLEAEARKATLTGYGMPETFVSQLGALADDLERAVVGREEIRQVSASARAGIEAALDAGLAAVRRLDLIVTNHLRDDPATLAVWEQDRRVDGGSGVVTNAGSEDPAYGQ